MLYSQAEIFKAIRDAGAARRKAVMVGGYLYGVYKDAARCCINQAAYMNLHNKAEREFAEALALYRAAA